MKLCTALTPLALACTVLSVQAQTSSNASPAQALPKVTVEGAREDYRSPETSTANRTATPNLQSAQSVQVVPRAVIEDQGALQLADALRNVSGVQFDFGFNGAAMPLTILRGFPSTSMTAMSAMSGSSSYYVDGSKVTGVPINMANVQAVEVVKGPASVLYGRSEPGGLVNVVSKPISSAPTLSLEQTLGSYGLTRTVLDASGPLNQDRTLRGRVTGSYHHSDSIRDHVQDKLGALNASLSWVPNAQSTLTASLDFSDQRYRTDYGVPAAGQRPADVPWERQYNDSPELSRSKTTSIKLEGSHQIDPQWQIKAKLRSVRSDTAEMDISTYRADYGAGMSPNATCPGTGNPLCRYYFYVRPEGKYEMAQFNADLIGRVSWGGATHTLLLGFDSYLSRKTGTTYFQQIASVDVYAPQLGKTPPLDLSMAMPLDMEDRNRWTSLYLQDQVALGGGLFLTGALRHDRTSAIYAAPGTAPNVASFTTPRVGAVWQFAAHQSVYAQFQDAVSANNGRDTVTGAALAAERAKQFEVGHKIELLDGKLNSTLAVYELSKRNRGASVPIATPPGYNTVTVGKARSRGLEWDVSGQINKQLALIASYAYTDAVVVSDPTYQGKTLANVARHSGSLWARYQLDAQWSAGLGVFAQGQRQGDAGNTFQMPGYARADAMVAYRFGLGSSKAALQLNVDNLFNTKYYTGSHQFVQDWIKLGAPRTAKATLRLDY